MTTKPEVSCSVCHRIVREVIWLRGDPEVLTNNPIDHEDHPYCLECLGPVKNGLLGKLMEARKIETLNEAVEFHNLYYDGDFSNLADWSKMMLMNQGSESHIDVPEEFQEYFDFERFAMDQINENYLVAIEYNERLHVYLTDGLK